MPLPNDAIFGSSVDSFRIDSQKRAHSFAGVDIQCVMLFRDTEKENPLYSIDPDPYRYATTFSLEAPNIKDVTKRILHEDYYKFFGELQTISISSAMSTYPVRCLGKKTAETYLKGARVWAGTMIFTVLDRDVLYEAAKLYNKQSFDKYSYDDIPPFDIIITAANENGQIAYKVVTEVVLSHGGEVYSIDDLMLEQTHTFQAKHVSPFLSLDSINDHLVSSQFNNMITPRDLMDANLLRSKSKNIFEKNIYPNGSPQEQYSQAGQVKSPYRNYPRYSYENDAFYKEKNQAQRIRDYLLKTDRNLPAGPY